MIVFGCKHRRPVVSFKMENRKECTGSHNTALGEDCQVDTIERHAAASCELQRTQEVQPPSPIGLATWSIGHGHPSQGRGPWLAARLLLPSPWSSTCIHTPTRSHMSAALGGHRLKRTGSVLASWKDLGPHSHLQPMLLPSASQTCNLPGHALSLFCDATGPCGSPTASSFCCTAADTGRAPEDSHPDLGHPQLGRLGGGCLHSWSHGEDGKDGAKKEEVSKERASNRSTPGQMLLAQKVLHRLKKQESIKRKEGFRKNQLFENSYAGTRTTKIMKMCLLLRTTCVFPF